MGRECSIYTENKACRILVGKPKEKRDHYEDLDVDGRIMLKLILEGWDGAV
jgi:hypothetical protein